ncbi:branched-chain amino acid transport system substrate-binding protein [Actinomycetospora succinea]|uniref:Branched-chain amino acid transport system substrate-binding protein n=1 Tax=Actinomycetospora succinea TaxID=663603 RepID=A0A4R6VJN9_9PSEU|nr:ABC transporter substrate-binding protein [Actinomycetospora succinea]TDQ58739.1 branched-chain amino acid transport system substrate-binding protein [Actinomycetospora succinea]
MHTTVAAERTVALAPPEVFALFGTAGSEGWLFGARCDAVAAGAIVSMRLPLDERGGTGGVDVLGRITRVAPAAAVEIEHTQPWRGRLSLRFAPAGSRGTRVQVRASVPPEGVEWLLHRRGVPLPEPPDDGAVRLGAITTASGPGAVYSMSAELMARLAVDEINDDGGVAGRRVQLLTADDATDAEQAALEAERMARLGCRAVFVNATSASFDAVRRVLEGRGVLVVHTVINEGGGDSPTAVRFGERPSAQLDALVAPAMRRADARRWFFVGQSYVWSHGAHAAAYRAVAHAGGQVAGEELAPLGTTDFGDTIERIAHSGADLVLSTLVGADEVAFERQSEAAGLRRSTRTVSLTLEESTLAHIGPRAGTGLQTALGYFQDNPLPGNDGLLARYREAYGSWAPPVTALSETVYEAIHRYARVLHVDPDGTTAAHGVALAARRPTRRDDTIGARDLVAPRLYVAEAGPGGLEIVDAVAGGR